MRQLPARFDISGPHPRFGTIEVTNLDTRNEVQTLLDAVLPEFLRPGEAAAMLRLNKRTLDRYRIIGGGPAYYKFGTAVVYALADLADWAAARRYRITSRTDVP